MRLVIRDQFHRQSFGIWVFNEIIVSGIRQKQVAKPCIIDFVDCNEWQLPEPTFEIDAVHIEGLISSGSRELELSGLGKTLGVSNEKELSAVKEHLKDMKSLLFNELGVPNNGL